MNIESTRDYCLTLPLVTEDFPFDERTLAFRVLGRIFACLDMERPEWITTKCDAERAIELRERHSEIEPAWHWNKKYWNEVHFDTDVPDELVLQLVDHSLDEVLRKLPKRLQTEYAALLAQP